MPEVRAFVAGGHVYCHARRADRDVSDCLDCERLLHVDEKSSPPYIVCDVDEADASAQDPLFVEWWYRHHRRAR